MYLVSWEHGMPEHSEASSQQCPPSLPLLVAKVAGRKSEEEGRGREGGSIAPPSSSSPCNGRVNRESDFLPQKKEKAQTFYQIY